MLEHSFVPLAGGTFVMGSVDACAYPGDGGGPVREVTIAPFAMDAYAVSNDRFGEFVAATGYLTTAERLGTAFVFAGLLPDDHEPTRAVASAPWWREVEGAEAVGRPVIVPGDGHGFQGSSFLRRRRCRRSCRQGVGGRGTGRRSRPRPRAWLGASTGRSSD